VKLSTTRILVVDDFAPWRRMVALTLKVKADLEIVAEAENGMAAIQKALEFKPEMVILDIGLPDLNGIEVAREILASLPRTRIVFLTENTSADVVRDAMSTGAFAYVLKSTAARDLDLAVEAALLDSTFVSLGATGQGRAPGPLFGKGRADH
jgi:DNA-binding NarL/FixJ family response regulator